MKTANLRRAARRGQGMTEYIIIVALIAIASIGIISLFGDNIRRLFAMASDTMAGADNVSNVNPTNSTGNDNLNKKKMENFAINKTY